MYCSRCGTYNEDSYRFCLSCGTELTQKRAEELDHMTSDGRYIIEPDDWNVVKTDCSPNGDELQKDESICSQAGTDKPRDEPSYESEKSSSLHSAETLQNNTDADEVIVLRKLEPVAPAQVKKETSATESPRVFPRGLRIFLACFAVLVLWIVLTVVIIPGLNLRNQGAIIQVVVMCSALAVIKACWKTIIGDKSKSD